MREEVIPRKTLFGEPKYKVGQTIDLAKFGGEGEGTIVLVKQHTLGVMIMLPIPQEGKDIENFVNMDELHDEGNEEGAWMEEES